MKNKDSMGTNKIVDKLLQENREEQKRISKKNTKVIIGLILRLVVLGMLGMIYYKTLT